MSCLVWYSFPLSDTWETRSATPPCRFVPLPLASNELSVQILINATTTPPLIPLANGLAQSAVSFARFVGPIIGGVVWSYSIQEGPGREWPFNYALGFVTAAGVCAVGLLASMRIK